MEEEGEGGRSGGEERERVRNGVQLLSWREVLRGILEREMNDG